MTPAFTIFLGVAEVAGGVGVAFGVLTSNQISLLTRERCEKIAPERLLRQQDRPAPADDVGRLIIHIPACVGAVQQVGIPQDISFDVLAPGRPAGGDAWQRAIEETADRSRFIPEMKNAG